ncbi:hypothetical protein F4777DRAFT_600390 [Nemania sp. FL0916]|nr:hypothetical protein F4777DRAFT_600390 [Nemania sp. FL0916]
MYFTAKRALLASIVATTCAGSVMVPDYEAAAAVFPSLVRPEHGYGFMNLDRDGVYRSYHADGRVLDAVRFSREQIDDFLAVLEGAVRAGAYDAADMAADRAHFATVDSASVPEDQLLHPPTEVVPTAQLQQMKEGVVHLAAEKGPSKTPLTCNTSVSVVTSHVPLLLAFF